MERPTHLVAAALALAAVLPTQQPSANDARRLADAINAFAADLHPRLVAAKTPTCSPASIAIALAMMLPGARGNTGDELATVLRLPADLRGERLHAAAGQLLTSLGLSGKAPRERLHELRFANDLWTQSGHPIEPAYAAVLRDSFRAEHHDLSFRDDPDGARRQINAHIAQVTNDRIRELLPPGLVTGETRTVVSNALWLKAGWADEFNAHATKPAPFHLRQGAPVDVAMMRAVRHCSYAETPDWQCIVLPFRAGELVCEVMLPRAGKSLADAEQALLAGAHRQGMAGQRVDVHLPRFRLAGHCRLREPLQALGLRTAFVAGAADFTGISPKDALVIDDVVHQTWIEVDERGVEAAAATASVLAPGSAAPGKLQPPIPFVADRPFAFTLRHQASTLILFVGRVEDPRGDAAAGH